MHFKSAPTYPSCFSNMLLIVSVMLCLVRTSCFANIVVSSSLSGKQSVSSALTTAKTITSSSSSLRATATLSSNREIEIPLTSAISLPLPPSRRNFLSYLTFGWVSTLMNNGNKRPLEFHDLWVLEEELRMANASQSLETQLDLEKQRQTPAWSSTAPSKENLLMDFWYSPLTRAVAKQYKRQLFSSGVLKLVNTLIQFLPSLLIAKILSHVEKAAAARALLAVSAGGSTLGRANWLNGILSSVLDREGLLLSLALYGVLCSKAFLENQYFDSIITMGTTARGAISAAIYRKSLKLSPSGRQNNTMGEEHTYSTCLPLPVSFIHPVTSCRHPEPILLTYYNTPSQP